MKGEGCDDREYRSEGREVGEGWESEERVNRRKK